MNDFVKRMLSTEAAQYINKASQGNELKKYLLLWSISNLVEYIVSSNESEACLGFCDSRLARFSLDRNTFSGKTAKEHVMEFSKNHLSKTLSFDACDKGRLVVFNGQEHGVLDSDVSGKIYFNVADNSIELRMCGQSQSEDETGVWVNCFEEVLFSVRDDKSLDILTLTMPLEEKSSQSDSSTVVLATSENSNLPLYNYDEDVARQLKSIWSEILHLAENDIDEKKGFFDLGGNSLEVVLLSKSIENVFGVSISAVELFKFTRFAQQSEQISIQLGKVSANRESDNDDNDEQLLEAFNLFSKG